MNNSKDTTVQIEHMDLHNGLNMSDGASVKWLNWRVVMNLIIVGLSLGLFGYDNAFSSPLISLSLFIEKYQGPAPAGLLVFTARSLDLIICVPLVGAAFGAFLAIPLQKRFGRKKPLMLAYALLCLPGSMLQLFAPDLGSLVIGRFWNNVGISILTNIAPVYLSELVPANVRARAVGFTIAGSGAVGVIATVVVWASEKLDDSRQYILPLAIQAAAPLVLLLASITLTESPNWLSSKGRIEEAKQNLMSLRSDNVAMVEAELVSIILGLQNQAQMRTNVSPFDIFKPQHIERTISSGALMSLSQVGGQVLTNTYSTVILIQSGVADPFEITMIVFLLQFLGTLIGPFLIDKVGRRRVALVGFAILFIIDVTAGALACAGLKNSSQTTGLAALCIIFSFVNSLSFQSLAFLMPTEIPTTSLREATFAWSSFWSYTTAIITTFAVPQITSANAGNLGAKAFLIFGGCMALIILWTYFYLPETARRTLAEIDELYAAKIPKRKWRGYKTQTVDIPLEAFKDKGGSTAQHSEG